MLHHQKDPALRYQSTHRNRQDDVSAESSPWLRLLNVFVCLFSARKVLWGWFFCCCGGGGFLFVSGFGFVCGLVFFSLFPLL